VTAAPDGWQDTGVAADLPAGTIAAGEAGGVALAVVRHADGWRAFADACTHARCRFTRFGELDGTTLICNCHGAEFDLETGAVTLDPAERPLALLAVRVVDGRVQVFLDE
jgi:nitrite reductase/ring-hydroxylating ferredoxin subunit